MTDPVLAVVITSMMFCFFCCLGCMLFLYKLASMVFGAPLASLGQQPILPEGPLPSFYTEEEEEEDNIDDLINSQINQGTVKEILANADKLQKEGLIGDITVKEITPAVNK